MGYSAGASRVLPVALAMHAPVAFGIVALAGDIGRPVRASTSSIAAIARTPVLLICNSGDVGPATRPVLWTRAQLRLSAAGQRGVRDLELRRLPGVARGSTSRSSRPWSTNGFAGGIEDARQRCYLMDVAASPLDIKPDQPNPVEASSGRVRFR